MGTVVIREGTEARRRQKVPVGQGPLMVVLVSTNPCISMISVQARPYSN